MSRNPSTEDGGSGATRTRRSSHRARSRSQRAVQLELPVPTGWGGRRAGAGRPRGPGPRCLPHEKRPEHRAAHPVHVTLRSVCRSLRTQFVFPTLQGAIASANRRGLAGFRIVHFSVQSNHLHLVVEASDRRALLEGVRGICIRIARNVNRLLSRRGRFFADRWHGRALKSPRAVRNALRYVIANFRKHHSDRRALLDVYSSALYFPDFLEFPTGPPIHAQPGLLPRALAPGSGAPVVPAETWLLSAGWKRHGKLSIAESPAH